MDKYTYQLYSKILKLLRGAFFIILLIAFIVVVFPYVKSILLMLIISWFLSVLLTPLVNFLESKGLMRGLSTLLIILIILGLIVFGISLFVPWVISTGESIIAFFQSESINNILEKVDIFFRDRLNNPGIVENITNRINELGITLLHNLTTLFKSVGSFIASVAIIPLMTFFLLKDSRRFRKSLVSLVPNKYFELSVNIINKIGNQVGHYIRGLIIDALIVGILSVIGLYIINLIFDNPVPYFVFVGLVAGVANLIPYLGPVVGAIPALVIAIISNPPNLLVVLISIVIMFVIVQRIDNDIIYPLVISRSVNMHPLTVIVVVIIGANLAGLIGMLLAIPITAIIKVTISEFMWGLRNYRME